MTTKNCNGMKECDVCQFDFESPECLQAITETKHILMMDAVRKLTREALKNCPLDDWRD